MGPEPCSVHAPFFQFSLTSQVYYTIFQKSSDIYTHFSSFGEAVLTCASDVGDIIAVDYMDTTNTVEIWVRKKGSNENLCMVLFECHDFIVTYKE